MGSFGADVMVIIPVVRAHPTCPHERHTFLMVFHGPQIHKSLVYERETNVKE